MFVESRISLSDKLCNTSPYDTTCKVRRPCNHLSSSFHCPTIWASKACKVLLVTTSSPGSCRVVPPIIPSTWVICHVPMFHITQPLGIWSINLYNGYYKVMSNIPKMVHLPTTAQTPWPQAFCHVTKAPWSGTLSHQKPRPDLMDVQQMLLPSPDGWRDKGRPRGAMATSGPCWKLASSESRLLQSPMA